MQLLIIFLCLLLNALFSCVEMAFVTIGKPELRQRAKRGDRGAKRLLALRENPERALSVIQVGITLVGAISAAVGGAGAEETFAPYLERRFAIGEELADGIAITLVIVPLTYLSVVIGELVPKTIALRYPNQILKFGTPLLYAGISVLGPLVTLLEVSTRTLLRLPFFRVKSPQGDSAASGDASSADESSTESIELAGLSHEHRQYILNLANIEAKRVADASVPWKEVQRLAPDSSVEEIARTVIRSGHTRLPVATGARVLGVLNSKEFLAFAASGNKDWSTIIRDATLVKSSDSLLAVLRRLQISRKHMAIVVDNPNQEATGIITLEDILEEVVGDIFDEDDDGRVKRLLVARRLFRR